MKQLGIGILLVLVLAGAGVSMVQVTSETYAVLTVAVHDVYGNPLDNVRVSVSYQYPRPEDASIPDQFTVQGTASFTLKAYRTYYVTVVKAGFSPHSELVELEEDTTFAVVMEYQQPLPELHVTRFTIQPDDVGPGEQFELLLVIENEGTGDALNVTIFFASTEFFSPIQPSSSAYFNRVDVGRAVSVNQRYAVSGEAPSGVYDLELTISYQDPSITSHTTQETVSISIRRKLLLKLLNISYPRELDQGQTFTFSVDVANGGRFAVNGIYLEVMSDMDWEYTSYYIGSLEAGDFDTFESDVTSSVPGEHYFTMKMGFVDDFNRQRYQETSFTITVLEVVKERLNLPEEKGLWDRFIEFLKAFLGLR
ncbi:MAG: hypothetical protein HXS52_10555 [Theionarchaea archaeon]|nr:hypothetical protein [Theionarchaea archaeon]MBU7038361.1 hypothetical protein [Theionarchaea archaeon]